MGELDRLSDISGVSRENIEALGSLDESHYGLLRAAVERARELRERELNEAIDQGLSVVPAMVRPMARRILFG